MLNIDLLEKIIALIKKKCYDSSTSITSITYDSDTSGTVWFVSEMCNVLGRVDFDGDEISLRTT